jgi:hypothetical protein
MAEKDAKLAQAQGKYRMYLYDNEKLSRENA